MKRKADARAPETAEPTGTFEEMMERLETIVARLEEGDLPLEESIRSFEEGVALVKKCGAVLSVAEKRIQELTRGQDGTPVVKVTEDEEEGDDEEQNGELPF
ncbi:MAG: exodeoxyribonuclease VII small subunit [Hyphomicrobiales bacterium]